MTTYSQVVLRARRRLMTSHREPLNVLTSGITDTATTFALTYDFRGIGAGTRLDIDLEEMYVTGVSGQTAGSTVTVLRGIGGSTAAAHSAGAVVRSNPQWTNFELAQAVNDELYDLSSPVNGLFRIRTVEFDFNPSQMGYELVGVTGFLSVWQVRYQVTGPTKEWPVIPPSLWRVDQAANTTDFPSGYMLVLQAGGMPGQKVRVSYQATFDALTNPTDDVLAVSGLHTEAHDILSLGAAIRVLAGQEAQRSYETAQPNPRRADEVPPRTAVAALTPLLAQREDRVRAEAARLSRRFPGAI